jgi:hypothetical protein
MITVAVAGFGAGSAHADPLTIPGYTVTDLGPGTPTFSTDANGNGVLNAPDGQIFAFPQTPNMVLTPGQGVMANFPLSLSAPVGDTYTYGNPAFAFANVQSAVMNANGLVVATEYEGVTGHWAIGGAYAVQHNADGSWGSPVSLWSGNEQIDGYPPHFNVVTGVNNLNQVLGSMGTNGPDNLSDTVLYNVSTHTLIDLSVLMAATNNFNIYAPIALDDDGRILVSAIAQRSSGYPLENLLLTPDGVPATPLEVPAPEPGTLAVMLLAIAGFAAHRVRERQRLSRREKPADC